ncbi:hypothetical protein RI054_34g132620 [Pseudoscourfieldia marina]
MSTQTIEASAALLERRPELELDNDDDDCEISAAVLTAREKLNAPFSVPENNGDENTDNDTDIDSVSVAGSTFSNGSHQQLDDFALGGGVARASHAFFNAQTPGAREKQNNAMITDDEVQQQQRQLEYYAAQRQQQAAASSGPAYELDVPPQAPLVAWLASRGATGGTPFDIAAFAHEGNPIYPIDALSPLAQLACAAWPDDRMRLCQCVLRRPVKASTLFGRASTNRDITLNVVCPAGNGSQRREYPLLVARRAGNGAFAIAAADEPTLAFALVEKLRDGHLESRIMAAEDAPMLARLACKCTAMATRARNGAAPTFRATVALACAVEEGRKATLVSAKPIWDATAGAWRADLGGRPYKPSVKNCRVVESGDDVDTENQNTNGTPANVLAPGGPTIAQVGRLAADPGDDAQAAHGSDAFEVLFRRPLSAVQAFAISLSLVFQV